MGIKTDLKLTGNEFSNTATWFFIAYLIAEVPNGNTSAHHVRILADCVYSLLFTETSRC